MPVDCPCARGGIGGLRRERRIDGRNRPAVQLVRRGQQPAAAKPRRRVRYSVFAAVRWHHCSCCLRAHVPPPPQLPPGRGRRWGGGSLSFASDRPSPRLLRQRFLSTPVAHFGAPCVGAPARIRGRGRWWAVSGATGGDPCWRRGAMWIAANGRLG